MGQFGNLGMSSDGQPQGMPRGHGRRHSVNVVNKAVSQPNPGTVGFDGFDDGFPPPPGAGGHSRQTSRVDSSWRISK